MGQRHQLFVIAKIASRYRSLAAVYHQSLHGESVVERLLQLLKIFSAPANAARLHDELKEAFRHAKDETFWGPVAGKDSLLPENTAGFPFITTCLVVGASFDFAACSDENATPEPFNMSWRAGDNNDGMTVLDITDVSRVRYCFLADGRCDYLPNFEPISAHNFLSASQSYFAEDCRSAYGEDTDEEDKTPLPPRS